MGREKLCADPEFGEVRIQRPSHSNQEYKKPAVGRKVPRMRLGCNAISRLCRRTWDDKKAEQETPLYVGYIRYMYATILSISRMQIFEYILAFVCLALFAPAIALHP